MRALANNFIFVRFWLGRSSGDFLWGRWLNSFVRKATARQDIEDVVLAPVLPQGAPALSFVRGVHFCGLPLTGIESFHVWYLHSAPWCF